MQLLEAIRHLYVVSRIAGMAPFSCSSSRILQQSRLETMYSCLILASFAFCSMYHTSISIKQVTKVFSRATLYTMLTTRLLTCLTFCLSVLFSIWSGRSNAQKLLSLIDKVDAQIYLVTGTTACYRTLRNRVMVMFFVFGAVMIVVPSVLFIVLKFSIYAVLVIILYTLNSVCLFQYVTLVVLLRDKLRNVNFCLHQFESRRETFVSTQLRVLRIIPYRHKSMGSIFGETTSNGCDVYNLRGLRQVRGVLCDVVEVINSYYGIQVALVMVVVFCNILHGLTTFFKIIFNQEAQGNQQRIFYCLTIVCLYVSRLLFVVYWSDVAEREDAKTPVLLQKLYGLLNDADLEGELRRFLEHTQIQKIRFLAGGFAPINRAVLLTMFSSIATYLVILLQSTGDAYNAPYNTE